MIHSETRPKKVAFTKNKEIWTYERLATEVDRLARGLIEQGVQKGDRIALHNEMLTFATERLADYKVPETLESVDKIPRNTLGKIDRRLLLTMISKCESRDTEFVSDGIR